MILRVWDVTFTVADLRRAVDFYQKVLGLQIKYHFSTYAGFDCGGVEIGLVPGRTDAVQEGGPCVEFLVRDVDEACRMLSEQGVGFAKEPHDTPWGSRIAQFTDPDGHILQLVQIDWPEFLAACAPNQCVSRSG
jgi:catechol 2,3-dioxygenase-like lactoylglutathione lyase family enzyme